MKTDDKSLVQEKIAMLVMLSLLGSGLYGYTDVAPNYHAYQVTDADQYEDHPAVEPIGEVEFEYGVSDTTGGYLVEGIEVRAARFRGDDDSFLSSYNSYRKFLKPVAVGLLKYGLLVIVAVFTVAWLAVVLSKWRRPEHVKIQRRGTIQRHLAFLIKRHQINQELPDYGHLSRQPAVKYPKGRTL